MKPALLPLFTAVLGIVLLLPAALAQAQGTKNPGRQAADAPPQLISTDAGAPRWKNLRELEAFAAKGDPHACMELGDRLLEGDGYAKDPARARGLFEKAAEAGMPNAFFRLGKIHHDGIGVRADRAKGYEYFLEAAKRGVSEAQYNVGAQLASGRGVGRDLVEGLAWLIVAKRSGAGGDGEAQLRARLQSRPADIAAAEKRAETLLQALAAGADIAAPAPGAGARAPSSSVRAESLPPPPKVERPKFEAEKPAPPKVTMPVVPVPPPALPGKP